MDTAEVIKVIRTTLTRRGKGTEDSPIRVIEEFWSLDGELLASNDPCPERDPRLAEAERVLHRIGEREANCGPENSATLHEIHSYFGTRP